MTARVRSVHAAPRRCRVEGRGVGLDVGEHRDRAGRADRGGGRDRGERGHDDLVARTDAEGDEREAECVGTRRHTDRVTTAGGRRELASRRRRARDRRGRYRSARHESTASVSSGSSAAARRARSTTGMRGDAVSSGVTGTRPRERGRTRACGRSRRRTPCAAPSRACAWPSTSRRSTNRCRSRRDREATGTCSTRPVPAASTTASAMAPSESRSSLPTLKI